MGSCGVDIFLLLSGAGLYFSFKKNPDLPEFWRKRLLRILPSSVIVAIIVLCFSGFSNVWLFLARVTFLDFFLVRKQGLTFWYVPAILVLYLLFPLFFKIIKKLGYWGLALIVTGSVVLTLIMYFIAPDMFSQWELLLTRIPVFASGIILGRMIEKDIKISTVKSLLICLAGILYFTGMVFAISYIPEEQSFLKHYLYLPFAVLLVIIFSFVRSFAGDAVRVRPLEFLGIYSLEFYLIHQSLYLGLTGRFKIFEGRRLLFDITVIAVTLLLSVALKSVVNLFFKLNVKKDKKGPVQDFEKIQKTSLR